MQSPKNNVRRLRGSFSAPQSHDARRPVSWKAELTTGNTRFRCEIVNISKGGAKIRLRWPLPHGVTRVWLIVDFVGAIAAEPRWRKGEFLGLRFLRANALSARLSRVRALPPPDTDPHKQVP
jgi:hypothetical protein